MTANDWTVRAYCDEDREAFASLHRRWLVDHGIWEERDELDLADPVASYIDRGGAVFVAVRDRTLVASVAVTPFDERSVELSKLAVEPEWQGRGLGRTLLNRVLEWARTHGAARVVLISNSRLARALRIYEAAGFTYGEVPAAIARKYQTADVFMSKDLTGEPDDSGRAARCR